MKQIGFLLQNLLSAQHISGTIMPIIRSSRFIQMVAVCGTWRFDLQVVAAQQHPANRTHNPQLHTRPSICKPKRQVPQTATICINIELVMMGIMVSETCWANSKFCNQKTNLLHLVGLLFPRINDDARSNSHQAVNQIRDVCSSGIVVTYRRFGSTFQSHLKGQARALKMRPTGCTEMSVNNYQHTPRNITEEQKFHLLSGESLKPRLIKLYNKCKIFFGRGWQK